PGTVYALARLRVFKSNNGGQSWGPINTPFGFSDFSCFTIDSTSTSTVYVGTQKGGLLRSDDRGMTWSNVLQEGNVLDDITCLAVDPANRSTLFAGTPDSGLWISTDGGTGWRQVLATADGPAVTAIATVGGSQPRIYAGTNRGVYESADEG